MRTRSLTFLAGLSLLTVSLSGCSASQSASLTRSEAAKATATGVVAAASRRDQGELTSRFGRELTGSEVASLSQSVPATLGNDPIMYSANTSAGVDPQRDARLVYSVVRDMATPAAPERYLVTLTWDGSAGEWRVVEIGRDR